MTEPEPHEPGVDLCVVERYRLHEFRGNPQPGQIVRRLDYGQWGIWPVSKPADAYDWWQPEDSGIFLGFGMVLKTGTFPRSGVAGYLEAAQVVGMLAGIVFTGEEK